MTEINQKNVPVMVEALERTQLGTRVTIILPDLTKSKTKKEARTHYESMVAIINELRQLVSDAAAARGEPADSPALNDNSSDCGVRVGCHRTLSGSRA